MPFAPETATLSLDQIAELIARKRRREAGDPYMEDRIALTESDQAGIYGMLDGQPLAGAEVVAGYEDYPNRQGAYTRWYGNPNLGRPSRDEMSVRSDVPIVDIMGGMAGQQLEDTLAHEAGHRSHYLTGLLGTQAGPPQAGIDPYTETERIMTPEKDDRWHNVLYGESGPSYLSAVDRFEGTELASSAGDWIPVDQEAAARDSAIANQLAAGVDMRREGLLSEAVPLPPMLDRSGAEVEGFELRPKALLDAVTQPRTKSGVGGLGAWKQRDWEPGIGGEGDTLRSFTYPTTSSGIVEERQPNTLREAQAQNKDYYVQDGQRKLAITGDQLNRFKKSVYYEPDSKKSALTQWANIVETGGLRDQVWKSIKGTEPTKTIEGVKAQKPGNLSDDNKFFDNYMQNYYTGKKKDDPKFREDVKARLAGTVPKENKKAVSDAISSAVKIFGTDKLSKGGRMDKATMKKMLQDLGQIESGYRTRIAGGGRPERGYWQVLPSTAKDALENAKAYFGPTFNKTFKDYDWVRDGESPYESLRRMSKKEISKLLESDDKLGAAFAAVQVLRTFDK
jgi:hypothetical protein